MSTVDSGLLRSCGLIHDRMIDPTWQRSELLRAGGFVPAARADEPKPVLASLLTSVRCGLGCGSETVLGQCQGVRQRDVSLRSVLSELVLATCSAAELQHCSIWRVAAAISAYRAPGSFCRPLIGTGAASGCCWRAACGSSIWTRLIWAATADHRKRNSLGNRAVETRTATARELLRQPTVHSKPGTRGSSAIGSSE